MILTATTHAGTLAADADAYTLRRHRHIRAHLTDPTRKDVP